MRNEYSREQYYPKSARNLRGQGRNKQQMRWNEEEEDDFSESSDIYDPNTEDNDYYYAQDDSSSWNSFEDDDTPNSNRNRSSRGRQGNQFQRGPSGRSSSMRSGYYNQNYTGGRTSEQQNEPSTTSFRTQSGPRNQAPQYGYGSSQSQYGSSQFGGGKDYASSSDEFDTQNFYGKGPKSYKRSDDRIKEDVCDCLTDDPNVDASNIEVRVSGGTVTFSGTVPSSWMKYEAECMAETVSGVTEVDNELKVRKAAKQGQELSQSSTNSNTNSNSFSSSNTESTDSQKKKAKQ